MILGYLLPIWYVKLLLFVNDCEGLYQLGAGFLFYYYLWIALGMLMGCYVADGFLGWSAGDGVFYIPKLMGVLCDFPTEKVLVFSYLEVLYIGPGLASSQLGICWISTLLNDLLFLKEFVSEYYGAAVKFIQINNFNNATVINSCIVDMNSYDI